MKIAICDDELEFTNYLKKILFNQMKELGADCKLTIYNKGLELINDIMSFDAVFLDIDMPEISGLEIADYINKNTSIMIIFVSAHDELVYSSLRFQPFRFIRKAYIPEEISEAVQAMHKAWKIKILKQKFCFETKSGKVILDLDKVPYIEIYGHNLLIHTIDHNKPLEGYGPLSVLEQRLEPMDFVRVHKSFLVNCRFIYSIEFKQLILDDDTIIPLSRYKADYVKEKFRQYLRSDL